MIGETVSHYEVLEKLGEGGMGVVYKARDLRLQRFVALKFLPPEVTATAESVARFEAEARAISALNHPHIATIHAMDEIDGSRFLVLEFLPGGTLRERLREYRDRNQPFPIREAVSQAIEMAEGLGHAHRNGFVHRDMKPENVMFTAEGLLRITDFGLAKSAGSIELTRAGSTVGTAAYMAPEQAIRNETSPRSDLFSLGIILHEMIAGKRPFSGESEFATMYSMVHDPPPPLRQLRPEASPALERIVLRLLEKDPSKRYPSGEALAAELAGIDTEAPTATLNYFSAKEPTTDIETKTMVSLGRIRPSRMRLLIGAAALVMFAIIAVVWYRMQSKPIIGADTQLAVLPFTAASGKAEDTAFGEGLSEIVATRLASASLWIVPENDLQRNRVTTPQEAHRVFGIPLVLTGSIERQVSGGARVTLHVVDTLSGRAVRSTSMASANAGLQEEVIRQAAAMLGVSLALPDPAKLRGEHSRTANAYDYYVQGNGYLQRYDQAGNVEAAIASFQRAIQLDPSYALAYAGLSAAYWRRYRFSPDQQNLELARDAAMQALSRNESLDSPHITLGAIAVSAGQVDEGIRQLRIALDRDPVNADAYRELASAYASAGKLNDAEETYKRAIQYRPNFWLGYSDLGIFYNGLARYEEAEKAFRQAAALTPDNYIVYRNLGGVQQARGEWKEAESSLGKAAELRPSGSVYSMLGAMYLFLGRYNDAIPVLEKAVALSADERGAYVFWGNLGDAYRWAPGQRPRADHAYGTAIELAGLRLTASPNDPTLLSRIAVYHAKKGETGPAKDLIQKAVKVAPKDPNVLFRSVIVLELAGQRKLSLAALEAALAAGYSLKLVEGEPELASLRNDPAYSVIAAHAKEQK
jgi:serine/threonine protein kinase/tetratricopeptide (TPR) repeat protein